MDRLALSRALSKKHEPPLGPRSFAGGLLFGAGLAFLFDPALGAARRALVRDKTTKAQGELGHAVRIGSRDLANRVEGLVAKAKGAVRAAPQSNGHKLEERVRAALGHVCSHPSAIEVHAEGGGVELKGPVLADEVDPILHKIARVRGVREIDNDLEPHEAAEGIPALQGGSKARKGSFIGLPAAKLLLGAGSLALGLAALTRGQLGGAIGGSLGALYLARSILGRRPSLVRTRGAPAGRQLQGGAPNSEPQRIASGG